MTGKVSISTVRRIISLASGPLLVAFLCYLLSKSKIEAQYHRNRLKKKLESEILKDERLKRELETIREQLRSEDVENLSENFLISASKLVKSLIQKEAPILFSSGREARSSPGDAPGSIEKKIEFLLQKSRFLLRSSFRAVGGHLGLGFHAFEAKIAKVSAENQSFSELQKSIFAGAALYSGAGVVPKERGLEILEFEAEKARDLPLMSPLHKQICLQNLVIERFGIEGVRLEGQSWWGDEDVRLIREEIERLVRER